MTKIRKISLGVFCTLLSVLVLWSGFMMGRELYLQQKEKEKFQYLAELVQIEPSADPEKAIVTEESALSQRDLSPLFAGNPECIGWLSIAGTAINYPVMHTPDDPQKYLRRDFNGNYSQSGVPFLDGRCRLDSANLILYGHNMKNGTMFSALKNYTDTDFWKSHPVIVFQTANDVQRYDIIDVIITDITDVWYSKINSLSADRFITLSTCYGKSKTGRLLIIGKQNKW